MKVRIRSIVLVGAATVGIGVALAGPAAALDLGSVSVPVPVSVPVALPPLVASGPIVAVTTSPQTPVGIAVTLPAAIGPIPLLPGAPHSVQVTVGGDEASVAIPPPSTSTPAPAASGSTSQSRAPRSHPASPAAVARHTAVVSTPVIAPSRTARSVRSQAPAAGVETPGAVSAALRRPASGGAWSLLHDVTSARALWLALLLALLVARWAIVGVARDARRAQSRSVSAA